MFALLALVTDPALPSDSLDRLFSALQLHQWYPAVALTLMILLQVVRTRPEWPLVGYLNKLWFMIPDGWRWLPATGIGAFVGAFSVGADLPHAIFAVLGGIVGVGVPANGWHAVAKESPLNIDGGAGGSPLPGPAAKPADW